MMTKTHALFPALLLGTALALAGCDQPAPDVQGLPDDRAKQENAQQRVLAGKVMYRERMAMPPEATVTVTLADVSRADAPARMIAEQQIDNPGNVPVPFALRYDKSFANNDHPMAFAVRAEIRDGDGRLLWTTTKRHTVALGDKDANQNITVMLERVNAEAQAQPASDKAQAKADGASFWAVGNEPGWHLAVYPEKRLVFVWDYGNNSMTTPNPGAKTEGTETIYMASTETGALKVEFSEQDCEDTMSGEAFPYKVKVTRNGTLYSGCGQDL
ncbi:MAG: YbaY family lipoprotein [Alloalcanivorax sp.]